MKIYRSIGAIFIVNVLTGTLEQFLIVNVGFLGKKTAEALLDFQMIVNPGGGKC